jgi:hypothetical protein
MKIVSSLKNNKSDNAIKRANLLGANRKIARYNGMVWTFTVQSVGDTILASAECMQGNVPVVNLFDKTVAAKDLLKLAQNRLYS